jgi:hypothetical protein
MVCFPQGLAFGKEESPMKLGKRGTAAGIKTLSNTKLSGGMRNEKNA